MHPDNKKALMNSLLIGALVSCFMLILVIVLMNLSSQPKRTGTASGSEKQEESQELDKAEDHTTITAVFLSADTQSKNVTVQEVNSGEVLTFDYSGGTSITDKYDQLIVSSQIGKGKIVTITYRNTDRKLKKLSVAQDIWEKIGITDLVVDSKRQIITYMGTNYSYRNGTIVFSNEKEIKVEDILPIDYVTVRGSEEKVYSIIVTRGHGYIELTNEELYIGGLISVGAFLTQEITDQLILTVREGTHTVTVQNKKNQGNQLIQVERDQTTVCAVNEFGVEPVRNGTIDFILSPDKASLFIDGKKVDPSRPISLLYGDHEIEVSQGGYITYQGILNVSQESQTVTITLPPNSSSGDSSTSEDSGDDTSDNNSSNNNSSGNNGSSNDGDLDDDYYEDDDAADNDSTSDNSSSGNSSSNGNSSGNSSSGNSSSGSGSSKNKTITIYWTDGADVYFDGEFAGEIKNGKLTVPKQIGEITVDLVLDGKDTVTYNIVVDDDGDNAVFEFPK